MYEVSRYKGVWIQFDSFQTHVQFLLSTLTFSDLTREFLAPLGQFLDIKRQFLDPMIQFSDPVRQFPDSLKQGLSLLLEKSINRSVSRRTRQTQVLQIYIKRCYSRSSDAFTPRQFQIAQFAIINFRSRNQQTFSSPAKTVSMQVIHCHAF